MEPSKITVTFLRALKPKDKKYSICVGNSLYLKVLPSGSKIWEIILKHKGKRTFQTIGRFPDVQLSEARKICSTIKQEFKSRTLTTNGFKTVALEWLKIKETKVKKIKDIKLRLNRAFIEFFNDQPIDLIKPLDVVGRLNALYGKENKLETIKRCCNIMAQVERYAHTLGYLENLQMQHLNELFKSPTVRHMPSMHPSQLKNFFITFKEETHSSRVIFNLALVAFYTLLRPSEYTHLKWSWIDFKQKVINIPANQMKKHKDFKVPISIQLENLLKMLKIHSINDYVFPSSTKDKAISIENFSKFLRLHGFKDILVPHGIRSIGRTWFTENGVEYTIAEMCLSHDVGSRVSLAYNRYELLEERREVMQRWADYVESCL